MVNVTHRWHILVFILLFLLAAGCRPQEEDATPTPFGTWSPVGDSRPVTVDAVDVIESPDSYEGAYIQLSGQYERLPLLVCGSDTHPSPATWQLTTPDGIILASGRESELRRIVPDGLLMTVTGRMTYFEGAIGCGKRAKLQEMWVLDVDQIISPNPIARVTLTPDGFVATGGDVPNVPSEGMAFPTTAVTPTPQLAFPTETPLLTPTPPLLLSPTSLPLTPAITPTTPSFFDDGEGTPTATPSGDEDEKLITPTVVPTSDGTSTIVAITSTPTGGATVTPQPLADGNTVKQGNLVSEEVLYGELETDEGHSWSLDTSSADTLIAYAVGDEKVDVRIIVVDTLTGAVLATQDNAGAGEVESLALEIDGGSYDVIVAASAGENGRYSALYTFADADIIMEMLGLIAYGQTESGALAVDNDQYWVFSGEAGDEITIDVQPTGTADLIIELDGQADYVDVNGAGGMEQLSITLPNDGLYVLQVVESDGETAVYAITITKTN